MNVVVHVLKVAWDIWIYFWAAADSKVKVASGQSTKWITRRASKSGIATVSGSLDAVYNGSHWVFTKRAKGCGKTSQVWLAWSIHEIAWPASHLYFWCRVFFLARRPRSSLENAEFAKRSGRQSHSTVHSFFFTHCLWCCRMSSQLANLVSVAFSEVRYDESTDSPRNRKYGYAWPSECGQLTGCCVKWYNPKSKRVYFDSNTMHMLMRSSKFSSTSTNRILYSP